MLLVAGAAAALTLPVAHLVNSIVPNAYMDEIFHIPQAQNYCEWKFNTWDPMITTFPGLYILSFVFKPLMRLAFAEPVCTVAMLRSVNFVLSVVCVYLFRGILIHLDSKQQRKGGGGGASLKALVLAMYPLHWFFTFLYYTDTGSTAAVMAMYLACLKRAYWLSALLSVVAIMFRQTNAVWTLFVLCTAVIQFLQDEPAFRGRRVDGDDGSRSFVKTSKPFADLRGELQFLLWHAWDRRWEALRNFLPFLTVVFVFIMFVLYNGSIVVGAKDAHRVSPHFAQLLYVAVFITGVLAPFHFTLNRLAILQDILRRRPEMASGIACASVTVSLFIVHYFSLAHPYLLADNRHYTFYIWKDVIQSHWTSKYLLAPVYVYAWWSIIHSLKANLNMKSKVLQAFWMISFCGATFAVLVPAPLVEFRYFTVPFYVVALHTLSSVEVSSWKLWATAAEFLLVNFVTMKLFLFRPFNWTHQEGIQRFLW